MFLEHFHFPDAETETTFIFKELRTSFDTWYPFQILSAAGLTELHFEPVTILYGGNGCGKTTALNVMAEAIRAERDTRFNKAYFFEDYVKLCRFEGHLPREKRIITSDDVFDFMLNLRSLNDGIDQKRDELFQEYVEAKYARTEFHSLEDYDRLKQVNEARRRTQSRYTREHLMKQVREHSNGESAWLYFTEKIKENGLYLLDEPENSLSPEKQQELLSYITEQTRFYDCQFIIATHSPFLLSMKGARIYDLDARPADVKRWTELPGVRDYYDFFKQHEGEFE